ncbi:cytosine permease [Pseudomonas fluorescens]|uniref:cytosine permease n=1 Tax=Pseudomonas fluorescens TaxID=294 RepID=UPI001CD1E1EB|nr:cytosine permease [Pseudomonas fluorescens]
MVIPSALSQLCNQDLVPTQPEGRTWGTFSLFAMWMSDVHSVGGYTFAASLFFLGLAGWQVLLSMTVGIKIVYFLMNLIGRPSQKYGIPFPVVARLSFGVMGANLAATVRGIVGIVWYGVQTSRFAKSESVMKKGNFWGLPVNFIKLPGEAAGHQAGRSPLPFPS